MKIKGFLTILILISILLSGCDSTDFPPDDATIAYSGDVAYYATIDKDLLLNRHIEVSGTVSGDGYTTLFIGDQSKDSISFSCTFSENTPALESIGAGSSVRLHGICTSIVGNCIYLDRCQLSEPAQTSPTTDTASTSAPTAPTTAPATVPSATVPPTSATVSPTTVPTTVPPITSIATTPVTTEPLVSGILFIKWPETVSRNETAEVTIQGKPETEYTITVYYKSGPSSAKGLEAKTSDSSGRVSWFWKVGGKTSPGTFRIVVSGGGTQNTVHFTVIS